MVSGEEIREAVKAVLETVFPGETVYENLVPQNFERPSSLVTLPKLSFGDMANELFACRQDVEITLFMPVDDYHDSQVEVLELRMRGLCDQLSTVGYLACGDRALDVEDVTGALGYDYATIAFTLAWQEWRKRTKDYELMEYFYFDLDVGTEETSPSAT